METAIKSDKIILKNKIEVSLVYPLQYSSRLFRTIEYFRANRDKPYFSDGRDPDFYDTLKVAAEIGVSPPTAGEEQRIYVESAGAEKLREVEELRDYFGNNDESWYAWGWTLTGLRFRKKDLGVPYNIGDKIPALVIETNIAPYLSQITDSQFKRVNWKDIIRKANRVVDELPVPYSREHVIRKMHPNFGIFTEVEQTTEHNEPHALHGWLRENLDVPKDPISGQYDVAVGRRGGWRHVGVERCLDVVADFERSDAYSLGGFRLVVRGSVPQIGKAA